MKEYKYVIIGGGMAGGSAVTAIRQVDADGSLVLVTQEPHRPYERPPLSKEYLLGSANKDRVYIQPENYYSKQNVDLLIGITATGLNPENRTVTLENGETLKYERLLLATGARSWRLPVQGSDLPGVFTLRSIEDSDNIRAAAGEGKRALILGGSFIGSEVASSLAQLGTQVTMIFPEQRLLQRVVPQELSDFINAIYIEHGVRILPETVAERLEGRNSIERAVLKNGETLDVDLVVMGVGIRLNTTLAQEAGLAVREGDNAVLVDETLRTNDPSIYAAGDIAVWPDTTFGTRLRVEHWDVARRQGLRAGRNMAGDEEPYKALPYFFSDLFDLSFEVWGNLSNWDRTVIRGSLETGSFAYYYFDQEKLAGVLAVDRPNEERVPMQSLIKARPNYESVSERLRNEHIDLAELANGMSAEDETSTGELKERQMAELSFEEDIRPLFRESDVEEMKDVGGFDLWDYEDVVKWAQIIYSRMADGSMPCDGPWPDEQLEMFKQWMDQGMKQ